MSKCFNHIFSSLTNVIIHSKQNKKRPKQNMLASYFLIYKIVKYWDSLEDASGGTDSKRDYSCTVIIIERDFVAESKNCLLVYTHIALFIFGVTLLTKSIGTRTFHISLGFVLKLAWFVATFPIESWCLLQLCAFIVISKLFKMYFLQSDSNSTSKYDTRLSRFIFRRLRSRILCLFPKR